jgi:(R,R)-butanediol dehydrogenase / meso-butanediol dehydrogenase / diacetyl reductase
MASFNAVRFHGRGDVRFDKVEALPCGPDEVRILIGFCGICGTDLKEFTSGPIMVPQPDSPRAQTGAQLPVILGHEFSGTVTEVGSSVVDLKTSDRVTVMPNLGDAQLGKPQCAMCESGRPNLCTMTAYYGLDALSGGFSEQAVAKASNVFKLPGSLPLEVGALVEPLSVAWHMVRTSGFQAGQDALIQGAGPIGLGILLVLKVVGARKVLVSEVLEKRKAQAVIFGADIVIDPTSRSAKHGPTSDPIVQAVREMTPGNLGVHVSFDASGLQSTLDTAIAATRPGGTVFNVAIHSKPLLINPNDLVFSEKKYTGGVGYTANDFVAVISALDKDADFAKKARNMISSIVPLEDAVEKAFKGLLERKEEHIKILVGGSQE